MARRGRPRLWQPHHDSILREMLGSGHCVDCVATTLGFARSTCHLHARRLRIEIPKHPTCQCASRRRVALSGKRIRAQELLILPYSRLSSAHVNVILEHSGRTLNELALLWGVSPNQIRHRAGINSIENAA